MKRTRLFSCATSLGVLIIAVFFALQACKEKEVEQQELLNLVVRLAPPKGTHPLDVSELFVVLENIRTGQKDSAKSVACQPLRFHLERGNYNITAHGKKVEGKHLAVYAAAVQNVPLVDQNDYVLPLALSYVPNPEWKEQEGDVITTLHLLLPASMATESAANITVEMKESTTQQTYTAVTNERGLVDFKVPAGNYTASCSGQLVPGKDDTKFYGHLEQVVVANLNTVHRMQLLAMGTVVDGSAPYELSFTLPQGFEEYSFEGETVKLQKLGTAQTYELKFNAAGETAITALPYAIYILEGLITVHAKDGVRDYVCRIPRTEVKHLLTTEGKTKTSLQLQPLHATSALVIKEIYYSKSKSTVTGKNYINDGYFEIYNNSEKTVYLDGVSICATYQNTTGAEPIFPEYKNSDRIIPCFILTFPGTGKEHPLAPGKSVVMAENALNHKRISPGSPVDLSKADFEIYDDDIRDSDVPEVPNMIKYYSYSKTITTFHVVGALGWYIMKADKPMEEFLPPYLVEAKVAAAGQSRKVYAIPSRYILDGVLGSQSTGPLYRPIPASVDAGYTYCSKTYSGKAVRRKILRKEGERYILQDTNNSTVDFIPDAEPSPFVVAE